MRLRPAPAQQQAMQLSLTQLGQLTSVHAFRPDAQLELFDGFKRLRAARELRWPTLRVCVHDLDTPGAKVRMLRSNTGAGLSDLEEAWLVRSLYREDHLSQPQIAMLLSRHKSWVCRRLSLAEGLSDTLTAHVRLGLVPATAAAELARLQRCNQDEVAQIVTKCGLTTRQTARLVQRLLTTAHEQWPELLEQAKTPSVKPATAAGKACARRTPAEQIAADTWAMKRVATRLHARLLERSLASLGEATCEIVSKELAELRSTLGAFSDTLDNRLTEAGETDA